MNFGRKKLRSKFAPDPFLTKLYVRFTLGMRMKMLIKLIKRQTKSGRLTSADCCLISAQNLFGKAIIELKRHTKSL